MIISFLLRNWIKNGYEAYTPWLFNIDRNGKKRDSFDSSHGFFNVWRWAPRWFQKTLSLDSQRCSQILMMSFFSVTRVSIGASLFPLGMVAVSALPYLARWMGYESTGPAWLLTWIFLPLGLLGI